MKNSKPVIRRNRLSKQDKAKQFKGARFEVLFGKFVIDTQAK